MAKIYQLKIQLVGVTKPPIWRQIQVNPNDNLYDLHNIIQGAMGWYNSHLHQFIINGVYYSMPSPYDDGFMETKDERKYRISRFLKTPKSSIRYEYDFGDGWEHKITLEKILETNPKIKYPHLVKGKSMCPPEDCGGVWGFMDLREAVNDPQHPEFIELREWLGIDADEDWNPASFDLNSHQQSLTEQYNRGKKSKGKEFMF